MSVVDFIGTKRMRVYCCRDLFANKRNDYDAAVVVKSTMLTHPPARSASSLIVCEPYELVLGGQEQR